MAAGADEQVRVALCEQDCAKTVAVLLETAQPELVHRALVWVTEVASAPESEEVIAKPAQHLNKHNFNQSRRCRYRSQLRTKPLEQLSF